MIDFIVTYHSVAWVTLLFSHSCSVKAIFFSEDTWGSLLILIPVVLTYFVSSLPLSYVSSTCSVSTSVSVRPSDPSFSLHHPSLPPPLQLHPLVLKPQQMLWAWGRVENCDQQPEVTGGPGWEGKRDPPAECMLSNLGFRRGADEPETLNLFSSDFYYFIVFV